MDLSEYKVTMLGASGVGKTVLMSSMYVKLRDGYKGVSIRAISNNVDLDLQQILTDIYVENNWPPGTEAEENYQFELLLRRNPVARIDWVDYRGGALVEPELQEGGSELLKRLQMSHAIIWMIDMSQIKDALDSTPARLSTGVGRMAQLCRQAVKENNSIRTILMVRTKSDEVLGDNGKPNWDQACEQLIEHVGHDNFIDIAHSAAIPVSSLGQLDSDKKPIGESPAHVEWPLILAVTSILDIKLRALTEASFEAEAEYRETIPPELVRLFKQSIKRGPSKKQLRAEQRLRQIRQEIKVLEEVINQLEEHRPACIKLFPQ